MIEAPVPAKAPRRKVRANKRQDKARRIKAQELERRHEERDKRQSVKGLDRGLRKVEAAFKGCDVP